MNVAATTTDAQNVLQANDNNYSYNFNNSLVA